MSAGAGDSSLAQGPVAHLLTPAAIRERCGNILAAAEAGGTEHFSVDRSRLDEAATFVTTVTRRRYPELNIPYHSRWRHFEAGGIDRAAELSAALAGRDAATCARARIDLTVVSVLLDAGAGPSWLFREHETGESHSRSEGLGVASFRAFMAGTFSADRSDPLRADAAALARIDAATLAKVFQVDDGNPLVGLDGRAALLRRLGDALVARQRIFGSDARPGGLYDTLLASPGNTIPAAAILHALLEGLGTIWLTGNALDGVALGDCWRHPQAGGTGTTAGWVPFHKLSQWLTYSLFEPFEWAGAAVTDKDALTGLPEYRNGGLLLDTGVLALKEGSVAKKGSGSNYLTAPVEVPSSANNSTLTPFSLHEVGSELIVEWRALTVALIDALAPLVRARLGRPDLPLACILEGGTWAAGRELAQRLRGGVPPLNVRSDGTVF